MEKNIAQLRFLYFIALFASVIYCRAVFIPAEINNLTGQILIGLILHFFFFPKSILAVLLFAIMAFIHQFIFSDSLVNDLVLQRIVSAYIIFTILWYAIKNKTINNLNDSFYNSIFPSLRILVVSLYFLCFFSKLNTDFLNVQKSFVSTILNTVQTENYVIISWLFSCPWIKPAAIWGTLVFEGLAWLLLLFKRTRLWVIVVGAIFHFFIGFDGASRLAVFSWLMLALYFVFLSDDEILRVNHFVLKARRILYYILPTQIIRRFVLGALFYAPIYVNLSTTPLSYKQCLILWIPAYVIIFGIYLKLAWETRCRKITPQYYHFWGKPIFLIILMAGIIFYNGLGIYLGFWSELRFAPFSNLKMLPQSNHLIVPSSTAIIFKHDFINILESNLPGFQNYISHHRPMTPLYFRAEINKFKGNIFVRCVYKGNTMTLMKRQNENSHHFLLKPLTLTERALIYL